MNNNSDPFWGDNILTLLESDRITEFFPSYDMSEEEKLNAVTRFSVYLGVILSLYKGKPKYLIIPVLVSVFTVFIYYNSSIVETKEEFVSKKEKEFTYPTKDNPFMNVLMSDYTQNPNKPQAADINDPEVKQKIKEGFENGLYMDVNDYQNNKNSQRQFYTMPGTTIPNDRDSLAKWLLGKEKTCKDGNDCNPYEDLRQVSPMFPFPDDPVNNLEARAQALNTRVQFGSSGM